MTIKETIKWIKDHLLSDEEISDGTKQDVVIRMAISALESQRWIPVTERMPNAIQEVVVIATVNGIEETGIAMWSGKGWFSSQLCCKQGDIKFWMPLPQPPKEEST